MKRLSMMFFFLAVIVAGMTVAAIIVRASGPVGAAPPQVAEDCASRTMIVRL